jgi:RNA polymerase sigma-70 factor (ECF subfamily)
MAPTGIGSGPPGEHTMDHDRTGPIDTPDAFRDLFAGTYPAIVAYARRRVGADRVDDVVSEVFTTAWRRRADLDPEAPALPWLYGVAANVVRNFRRTDQRHLRLVERIEAQPAPAARPGPADGPAADLRAAIERLSFDDQEVLRLVAWEGLSHAEVGLVLECSPNAVGIRIHRARKRLEVELDRLADPVDPTAIHPGEATAPPPDRHPDQPPDTDAQNEERS